jgi:hypothetical protein
MQLWPLLQHLLPPQHVWPCCWQHSFPQSAVCLQQLLPARQNSWGPQQACVACGPHCVWSMQAGRGRAEKRAGETTRPRKRETAAAVPLTLWRHAAPFTPGEHGASAAPQVPARGPCRASQHAHRRASGAVDTGLFRSAACACVRMHLHVSMCAGQNHCTRHPERQQTLHTPEATHQLVLIAGGEPRKRAGVGAGAVEAAAAGGAAECA